MLPLRARAMKYSNSSKLQHYCNLTIRFFSVIYRTLIGGGILPHCREAVGIFYSLSWLGIIKIDSASLLRFTLLNHVQVFLCDISLVCRLKYPYSYFYFHYCLLVAVLLIIMLSMLLLVAIISLSLLFLCSIRVVVLMYLRYLQCWWILFILLFWYI